ncbi:hypothetical protein KAJ83_15050 [Marivibrio halodurans]|uniref:Uncharacterized protein n=1 Tax=Marivibrio halodurans TaxID=2039722 RepID=A0A8J7SA93_9PROT|nr:hypothetical protein [Marivibrio halodurans]MBP5858337.1 hypothetical protein [Marivibrio halodurans]
MRSMRNTAGRNTVENKSAENKSTRIRAAGARSGGIGLAGAILLSGALGLAGCREAEQDRPLDYDPGTYQGQQDQTLSKETLDQLRERAQRGHSL